MASKFCFQLNTEDVTHLLADPFLSGVSPRHEHWVSIYYDTPEQTLYQHGYRLWIHLFQGHWSQRLQADGKEPSEWGIAGDHLDRTKLPVHGRQARALWDILGDAPLQPQFRMEVQRSRWDLPLSSTVRVTATLDRGELQADGHRALICTLELTLATGTIEELYPWLLQLAETRPLRLEDADAVTHGYGLLAPPPVTHHKAGALILAQDSSSEQAFLTIMQACLQQACANRAAVLDGQVEGVHQMRVGLRRLRSCLKLFRSLIPREISLRLVEELRWLNGFLGPARDWDVFLEEGLAPLFTRFPDKRGLQTLHSTAESVRAGHYRALRQCLGDPRYHRLILHWHSWLSCRAWRSELGQDQRAALAQPIVDFATALLKRHHRRVYKRGAAFADLTPAERHALRIRIKELRYAVEFFASLYDPLPTGAYARSAAALQDCLGALNDLTVAERLLDEAKLQPASPTRQLIEGWYACKANFQERDFAPLWEAWLSCERPWKHPG